MRAPDFFPGTKPSPSQHRLTKTNFGLAAPWKDLPSCPGREGTSLISGKLGRARLVCSLPYQIRGVSPQSSAPAVKNREKKTKNQAPLPPLALCFHSCCLHQPCQGSDPCHSLVGGHVLGLGGFTAALGRGQLCHVEEELLFLASPCSLNWGMGTAWVHAKPRG